MLFAHPQSRRRKDTYTMTYIRGAGESGGRQKSWVTVRENEHRRASAMPWGLKEDVLPGEAQE